MGIFLLLGSLFIDPIVFACNLFNVPWQEDNIEDEQRKFTYKGVTLFDEVVEEVL